MFEIQDDEGIDCINNLVYVEVDILIVIIFRNVYF